jgi:hypothetical protein
MDVRGGRADADAEFTAYLETRKGRNAVRIEYGDYRKAGKTLFPHRITMETTKPKAVLKLNYKEVEVNAKISEGDFEL